MPRPRLPEISYPLPNSDPRKHIENCIAPFIDSPTVIEDGTRVFVAMYPHRYSAFKQAFYRYRKAWNEAADTNHYLQHFSNVLNCLHLNFIDNGVYIYYTKPWEPTHV